MFEAISHPLRLDILGELAKRPIRFADLNRKLKISSSGLLDFHLKKMDVVITTNADGLYILNERGYAALQAVRVVSRHGWQRRAFLVNLGFFVVMTAWMLAMTAAGLPAVFFVVLFSLTAMWMVFYTYWTFIKRKVRLRENGGSQISKEN